MRIKTETTVGLFILVAIAAFLYLSFHIGFFRVDKLAYAEYVTYFKDVSGVIKNADVKIAGVKVGWVDSFDLTDDGSRVKTTLMVSKKYQLPEDTQSVVRQDGLLGIKFIELIPGKSPQKLPYDSPLQSPSRDALNTDDLIFSLQKIASDMQEVSGSLKNLLVGDGAAVSARQTMESFNHAAAQISVISDDIKGMVKDNQANVGMIIADLRDTIKQLKDTVPHMTQRLDATSHAVELAFNTTFKESSDSIKKVADEVHAFTQQLNQPGSGVSHFLSQEGPVKKVSTVIEKVQCCVDRLSNVTFGIDNNNEFYFAKDPDLCNRNYKSHFNFWLHPVEYGFLLAGFTYSKNGYFSERLFNYCPPQQLCCDGKIGEQSFQDIRKRKLNAFSANVQVGGYLAPFALRAGLFESTPGFAIDYFAPSLVPRLRWISSLEVYDFNGKNHVIPDHKPHVKWINRMYFNPNFYVSFGADDFASKCNRSAFLGFGLNFGDTFFKVLS